MSSSAVVALQKSRSLLEAKRPKEALEEIGPALVDASTIAEAYGVKALAHAGLKDITAALDAARSAQSAAPTDDVGFRVEGLIRINHLKGSGAIPPTREAVRLDSSLDNRYLLVHALRTKRDRPEARQIAERLVAEYPDSANALDALGICEFRDRNWPVMETLYRRAVELAPHEALFATRLGASLQGQGKTEQAVEAYRAAVRADPTSAENRRNLSNAGLRWGSGAGIVILLFLLARSVIAVTETQSTYIEDTGGLASNIAFFFTALWFVLALRFTVTALIAWSQLRGGAKHLDPAIRKGLAPDRRRVIARYVGKNMMWWLIPASLAIALAGTSFGWTLLVISLSFGALTYAFAGREIFALPGWLSNINDRLR